MTAIKFPDTSSFHAGFLQQTVKNKDQHHRIHLNNEKYPATQKLSDPLGRNQNTSVYVKHKVTLRQIHMKPNQTSSGHELNVCYPILTDTSIFSS